MTATLTDRISKAQAIARFNLATILTRTTGYAVQTVLVPGSEGKSYQVILRRENGALTTECLLNTAGTASQPCKGNQSGVCYHAMTAVIVAAADTGGKLSLHATESNAHKSGGRLVKIVSRQSGKSIFGSYKEAK